MRAAGADHPLEQRLRAVGEAHEHAIIAADESDHLDPALDRTAEAREPLGEDGLRAPLGQAALELPLAADAGEGQLAEHAQRGVVDPRVAEVLGGREHGVDDAGPVQDLERRRLQRRRAHLPVRHRIALHHAHEHAVAGQLAGGEQARRPGPDHENPIARVDHATIQARTRNT